MPRYASHLSENKDAVRAAGECVAAVTAALGGTPATVFAFCSADHGADAPRFLARIAELCPQASTIGAISGSGVLASGQEREAGRAAAVLAADADVIEQSLRLSYDHHAGTIDGLPDDLARDARLVVLVDAHTFPAGALVDAVNAALPGVTVVGGLTVGLGGGASLLLDGAVVSGGAVAAVLAGPSAALVSQGCRPIGPELTVTASDHNVVLELAGKPAVEKAREVFGGLSDGDRAIAERGVLVGLVVDENQPEYEIGDFVVRALLGADRETGGLVIGQTARVGQTLRFHARDPGVAGDELRAVLDRGSADLGSAGGALLFTCNGRGEAMFGVPDHDARIVGAHGLPVAGLFCAGEFGPVAGENQVHGFTATIALFP